MLATIDRASGGLRDAECLLARFGAGDILAEDLAIRVHKDPALPGVGLHRHRLPHLDFAEGLHGLARGRGIHDYLPVGRIGEGDDKIFHITTFVSLCPEALRESGESEKGGKKKGQCAGETIHDANGW